MIRNLQLVFDCSDPDEIARFWGTVLEYHNEFIAMTRDEVTEWRKGYPQYDGRGRMDDADGRRMAIYIQKVPELKSDRNRLRPEISVRDAGSFAEKILALGGARTAGGYSDVEGNEFSVVEEGIECQLRSIVIDALDPDRMLDFWSQATGYVASGDRCDPAPGSTFVLPFSDGEPRVLDLAPGLRFVPNDESKRVKNRLHLDLQVTDAEAHRDRIVALGATVLQWDTEHVLADPEGNEFCVT